METRRLTELEKRTAYIAIRVTKINDDMDSLLVELEALRDGLNSKVRGEEWHKMLFVHARNIKSLILDILRFVPSELAFSNEIKSMMELLHGLCLKMESVQSDRNILQVVNCSVDLMELRDATLLFLSDTAAHVMMHDVRQLGETDYGYL